MRLIRRVETLEAAERGAVPAGCVVGVAWSSCEERLGRALAAGESLAVDIHLAVEVGPGESHVWVDRAVERASLDPSDAGLVYGADGSIVGEVVPGDGARLLLTIHSLNGFRPRVSGGSSRA
jgi:hypothetical protein